MEFGYPRCQRTILTTHDVCVELIQILVDAKEDTPLYEEIMDTVVTDKLKPCVLWATLYGPLNEDNMNGAATNDDDDDGDGDGCI